MHRPGPRIFLGAIIITLVSLAAVSFAGAQATKPYTLVLTGSVPTSGTGFEVTAVYTNKNTTSPQQLGSSNLTPPAGYVLTKASVSQGDASVVNNVVQLRNLNLAPGQRLTATIDVSSAPCSTVPWSVETKQANNFSGLPGNDLTLIDASNLITSLCLAQCKKNATCTANTSNPNGGAQIAAAKSNTTGNVFESGNANKFETAQLTCLTSPNGPVYTSSDQNTYNFVTPEDRSKVVMLTLNNVPLPTGSTPQQLLATQQICFNAPYDFTSPSGGPPNTLAPSDPVLGGFTGLLPDCTKQSVGPCHDRVSDTAVVQGSTTLVKITLVAAIPSGLPGDPHMG